MATHTTRFQQIARQDRMNRLRRATSMSDDIQRNVSTLTEPAKQRLNRAQRSIYKSHREEFIDWLRERGKDEDRRIGYAFSTIRRTANDHDLFSRWAWRNHGGFTTSISTEIADEYLEYLAATETSDTNRANKLKSLKRYYRWQDAEWEPAITFSGDNGKSNPQDWLSKDERSAVREAALELGTVPDYSSLDDKARDDWKHILAERFRIPEHEVGPDEFEKANGFNIPSLIWASLDAGLRSIEVGRAREGWCDVVNSRLLMPEEQSSKGDENWSVILQDDTTEILKKWLEERETYQKYRDSDRLWLTREGRAYSSRTLNYLFERSSKKLRFRLIAAT